MSFPGSASHALRLAAPRWGYHDLEEVAGVVEGYQGAGIPLDTIWTDIDYMSQYRDFTFDPINFEPQRFRAFVDRWARCTD